MGVVVSGERDVSGGQTDTGDIVLHGGFLVVSSGGKIINTTVDSGGETNSGFFNPGTVDVLSGATASATQLSGDETVQGVEIGGTVFSAGSMTIDGSASSVTIDGGGVTPTLDPPSFTSLGQAIFSGAGLMTVGGTATDTILDGGVQDILNNAFASGTTISNGGWEWVDGTDLSATVDSGSEQEVVGGGTAISTTLDTGAIQYVAGFASGTVISGGTQIDTGNGRSIGFVSGATVDNGGTQLVSDEGYADLTMVSSGTLMLGYEGIAADTTLSDGGTEYVSSGGNAFSTVIYSGGVQIVSSGGYGADQGPGDVQGSTTIYSGGTQYVSAGGTAFYTYLSGGTQNLAGVASDTTIDDGGTEFVEAGATNVSAVINDGGTLIVEGGGAADDTIEDDVITERASEIVDSGGTYGGDEIIGGGYLELKAGAVVSGAITFAPDSGGNNQGELVVDGTSPPVLTINNFVSGDTIQFSNLSDLTLTAAYGVLENNGQPVPGEVDLYSGTKEAATLIFTGGPDTSYTLEPQTEFEQPGTFVEVDPNSVQSATIVNPTGYSINWNTILNNESNKYAPYVPAPGNSKNFSGVTVAVGVDFGQIMTQAGFEKIFPNYKSDPNLVFLYNAIGLKLHSKTQSPVVYLQTNGATANLTYTRSGKTIIADVFSASVSITIAQANMLTTYAESTMLSSLKGVVSKANRAPAAAQTALMDVVYNMGTQTKAASPNAPLPASFWTDARAAVNSITTANPSGTVAAWTQLENDISHITRNTTRMQADAGLIQGVIHQINSANVSQLPTLESANTIASAPDTSNYGFEVSPSTQYALDPTGGSTYTLLDSANSPDFKSIELPTDSAASYLVSYEVGTTWSAAKSAQPDQTVDLPSNVDGLKVELLGSNGEAVTGPTDFIFYVTYAAPGVFSGSVIEPADQIVSAGKVASISGGESDQGDLVLSGGTLNVLSNGEAFDATVLSGGTENVKNGGQDNDAVVSGGGVQNVYRGRNRA